MDSTSSSTNQPLVHFESTNSWIGKYQAAQQQTGEQNPCFKHVGERCNICMQDYLPQDEIQVLPCSHAFHRECFQTNERSSQHSFCLYDQKESQCGKITILGHTIVFKDRIHFWFYKVLEQSQESLIKWVQEQQRNAKDPEVAQKIIEQRIKIYQKIIDNLASNYHRQIIASPVSIDELKQLFLEPGQTLEDLIKEIDVKNSLEDALNELKMFFQLFIMRKGGHSKEISSYIDSCIDELGRDIVADPEFIDLARKVECRFYDQHRNALQVRTPFQQYSYLNRIEKLTLERLTKVSQREGISPDIDGRIKKTYQFKETTDNVCTLIFFLLLLCFFSRIIYLNQESSRGNT